jgi:hypothetical protein
MPALTISAVNTGTDALTITAHGLNTGDGACNALNIGGGALPSPLVAATSYWVIRVDANTIKLATSQANALAGTAIDITTTGSGTNQILIGLPFLRNTTYAAGAQVKSVDLNALQDNVTLYKKPPTTHAFSPQLLAQITGTFTGVTAAGAAQTPYHQSAAAVDGCFAVPCEVGDMIVGFTYAAFGNGVANATANLYLSDGTMPAPATSIGAKVDTARGAAWGDNVLGSFTPTLIAAGQFLFLGLVVSAAKLPRWAVSALLLPALSCQRPAGALWTVT